ncbi:MAG TPA: COX15/CtaA family protein [Terracidiphilus sp.]|nr:COX15/CtaA family protein [Terracidiphilus sp.]
MSSAAVPVRADCIPSRALRQFSWGVLAYFIAVILWGTVVRATGAGAGCGDHWPLCNGTVIQHSPTVDAMIEFAHRVTSGISFFAVVALAAWSFAATARGHLARHFAVSAVVFTLIEAAIGALLVKLGLTAESQSPLRAPYLALHLTNTLLLIAALALTAHMLGRRVGYMRGSIRWAKPGSALVCLVAVLIVGVTGSLAALGDTLFPAQSLSAAMAQDFSSKSAWLIRWRWTHPTIAVIASVFFLWLVARAMKNSIHWNNRGLALLVLILLAVQYALGTIDILALAPVWLQVVHLLGADLLWTALIVLAARLTLEPKEAVQPVDKLVA